MRKMVGDYLIAATILVVAIVLLVCVPGGGAAGVAVVTKDNEPLYRIELTGLSKPVRYEVDGPYHLVIEAQSGRIRFAEANCPDQVCVHSGWLSRGGQAAACVPSGVLIRLEGEPDADLDVMLR